MGKNLVYRILEKHVVSGTLSPGNEIAIKINQTLTQDATGTMAYLQFEALGLAMVRTELSVSYVDHNTVQIGYENADDHKYLQSVAEKFGIYYSRAGNGICHQVHLERFGNPGTTLLGSDSHTPTGGGIGQIAIGAGGLDIALAMGGKPFYTTAPKVIKINLIGELKPWVSAKDIVLKILETFTTKGNVGCVFEYDGEGVKSLSVPQRATITNMGAECGVTTSVFPSDEVTKKFLDAQGRVDSWQELSADNDAEYEKVVNLNLGEIEPMIALPHSPGNVKKVEEVKGLDVDQVCIGSCTNSSYVDLMTVAKMLEGRKCHHDVSFVIAPGSRQVLEMISRNGALATMLSAGARIAENACGFCIGNSQSPKTDAVSLRTSNRNFLGRSGNKSAQVYLVSPETAAAAVITGKITDPRSLDIDYPTIEMPDKFITDDSMIIKTSGDSDMEIIRGPNIGEPPKNERLPEKISGKVTIKVADKVTTDHIIPAGSKMKYRSNVPKYSEFLFELIDSDFYIRAKKNKEEGLHNIIIGGESYGQGSSREHAALCPMFMNVKAVIVKSFERIHLANLINFGILPLTFKNVADYEKIEQGDFFEIETNNLEDGIHLVLTDNGEKIPLKHSLNERQLKIIRAGGMLNFARNEK